MLGVYRGELTTVPLKASSGPLHFYLSQMLEAVEEKGEYRVRTHRYWYKLYAKPGLREHAILRWEYDSELSPDQPRECRHHVQLAAHLPGIGLDLNRAHVPTGWVPIEEVIRFLIVELGVKPPCGESWPEKLAASERLSHVQFTLP
ncbi:MAG: hypothetical protein HY721_06035 [Planctomycetes bacterium]|nr:hypothetical protein [Planctomycetota bacterium]